MKQKAILKIQAASTVLFSALILSSCSMSAKSDDPSLSIDLSSLRDERSALLRQGGSSFVTSVEPGIPPADVSAFQCYGVNVTGPGIYDTSPNADSQERALEIFTKSVAGLNHCAYRGVITTPLKLFSGSAEANLQIPPGQIRLVQIVGINDTAICASGVLGAEDYNDSIPRYFEIGRAVLRDVYSDRSLVVRAEWPTTEALRIARRIDCGDGGGVNPNLTITSIVLTPGTTQSIAVGGTKKMTATATFSNASTQDISSLMTWTSSNSTAATVSAVGLVTGGATGTTQISASYTPPGQSMITTNSVNFSISP